MFGFGLLFALVSAAVFQAHAAIPTNCDRTATVVVGDTCNSISAQYKSSTYQLAASNPETINANCSNLYAGEVVCLGLTGQDCMNTYVSQSGNTCAEIAATNNIQESTLLANNPNLYQNCTNLYPGEVLCVADMVYPYTT